MLRSICVATVASVALFATLGPARGAAAGTPGTTTFGARPVQVTLNGVAGARPGMTPSQLQHAWGTPVVLADPKHGSRCRMARIATGQVRAYALFQNGRLGAVFFTAGAQTDRGIRIGSSRAAVIEAYRASRLTFMPARNNAAGIHVYTKPTYLGDGRALRFDPDPRTGLVQQIGLGGRLLSVSTGRC